MKKTKDLLDRDDMRKFPYITVGNILRALRDQGLPLSRITYYKLEKEGLFASQRTVGRWRRYTQSDAELIMRLIKENYGFKA